MRISADCNSPHYHPVAATTAIRVTLNGRLVTNCVELDDKLGTVVVVNGHDDMGNQLREKKHGKVRVYVDASYQALWAPQHPKLPDDWLIKPAHQALARWR